MNKIIFHIDVNSAFLSWTAVELLKTGHHDIRDKVSVIGGSKNSRRGVVLAKSIKAKKFNIKTGERIYNAILKKRDLEVYPPDFELYSQKSKELFNYLENYTPDLEIFSIDECFIDYTPVINLYGDYVNFAKKIQQEIYDKFGYTVNIGIGNNKFCAKMASDFSKPNKINTLFSNEIESKLWPMQIEEMLWVGKKGAAKLKSLNINTIGDLANVDYDILYKYFKNQTNDLKQRANGIDFEEVSSEKSTRKAISNSTTFEKDLDDYDQIIIILKKLCENVALSLRRDNKYSETIAVIIKNENFKSYSHQKTLINATNLTEEIIKEAVILFDNMWNKEPIRLIGIRLDNLKDKSIYQLSIFEPLEKINKKTTLDKTIDELKTKFGDDIIKTSAIDIKKKNHK